MARDASGAFAKNWLRVNQEVLWGWVRYHLILYLQRRNPNVPGISDKL